MPAAYQPGSPAFEALEPAARAAVEAEAGAEIFRLECAACHTVDGHLGIRKLVRGSGVAALETILDSLARPVDAAGEPTTWGASGTGLRVETRLERRMPPFVGTDAEKRALAIHLARLGGDPEAGLARAATVDPGQEAFETHCAACHGADSPWPIAERLHWRTVEEYDDLIGRLDEVREEMPPFAGTEAERRALAEHLAALAAAGAEPGGDAVTPIIPLADPLPQPAPAWILWALLQLTFFCHLLAMNVVLGGSILALHWRFSRRPDDAEHRAAVVHAFSKALPVAIAAAVTLGVAPLLFVQVLYGRLFLTSSILMAWWWLAVVPLVILAYYGAYLLAFRRTTPGPGRRGSPRRWRSSSPRWPSSTPPTSRARSVPSPSSRSTARAARVCPSTSAIRRSGPATSTCSSGPWRWRPSPPRSTGSCGAGVSRG